MPERILCLLAPGEKLAPGVLVALAEGSQEVADLLDLPFRLPVINLWSTIRHYIFGNTTISEYLVELPS